MKMRSGVLKDTKLLIKRATVRVLFYRIILRPKSQFRVA